MFNGQTVLITGASSGIGRALGRRFAREGARLVLVARRKERLDELATELKEAMVPGTPIVRSLHAAGDCDAICDQLRSRGVTVDVLVNNAGVGEYGEFANQNLSELEGMMALNMQALVRLTHMLLPAMIERRKGWILNVASTAAYQPTPYMSVYGASKAFVQSFSLSLAYEVRRRGVIVTCLCPGPVATEFFDRGGFGQQKKVFTKSALPSEVVAEMAFEALARKKLIVVPGFSNRIGAFGRRILPLKALTRVTARLLRPVAGEG
ncbi:MAG TPA: SDR family oxidoreductase [Phycisphaerae bacterium]|nr:SDR family oxidoreductase [Phycisphaerae bacterium]